MHDTVKMPLTVSLVLDEIVNALLYKEVEENGQKKVVERPLPFRLKYRLGRNKATLDKDYKAYQQKSLYMLAKYGELTQDGVHLAISDPEKKKMYANEMTEVLSTIVEHTVVKLDPEDFDAVVDTDIPLSEEMMKILLGYLVDDAAFLEDISSDIIFKDYTPPVFAEEKPAKAVSEEKVEAPKEVKKTKTKKKIDLEAVREKTAVKEEATEKKVAAEPEKSKKEAPKKEKVAKKAPAKKTTKKETKK